MEVEASFDGVVSCGQILCLRKSWVKALEIRIAVLVRFRKVC